MAIKERKEMQEQIIESAGQIYNYLSNKGEVTINKMTKNLDLDENFVSMGKATPFAGWKLFGKCLLTVCDGKIVYKA